MDELDKGDFNDKSPELFLINWRFFNSFISLSIDEDIFFTLLIIASIFGSGFSFLISLTNNLNSFLFVTLISGLITLIDSHALSLFKYFINSI